MSDQRNTPPRSASQQPPLFSTARGVFQLWHNNLTDDGFTRTVEERDSAVQEQRQRAETLLNQVNQLGFGRYQDNPEMGLPQNLAGWADLLIEGALLPKPGLQGFHRRMGLAQQNQSSPVQAPSTTSERGSNFVELLNISALRNAFAAATNSQEPTSNSYQQRKDLVIEILQNEPNQKWRRINWMRASALSDDVIIEMVNEHFIPLAINITKEGFPTEYIPGLSHFETIYKRNWRFAFGFAGCAVLDYEGKIPLGHSATARGPSGGIGFERDRWVEFLVNSLQRHETVQQMRTNFARGDFVGGLSSLQELITSVKADIFRHVHAEMEAQRQYDAIAEEL